MKDNSAAEATGRHIFSVDLEEYFQVHAFDGVVAREEWDIIPSRVETPTFRLLELLERYSGSESFIVNRVALSKKYLATSMVDRCHE